MPVFILSEANLGLLGLGVSEPLPSWGAMLRELENYSAVLQNPWMLAPVVLLVVGGQLPATLARNRGERVFMLIRRAIVFLIARRAVGQRAASELRFCLRTDPKTFNPLLVEDESSETFAT